MGQSAQDGHLFFVHKIHRKKYPVERSGENARSPTVDIGCMVVAVTENLVSLRTSPQAGVAIPYGGARQFLPSIVPEIWRGLPRQCAHWLAMTAKTEKPPGNFPGGDFQLMRTFMNRLSTKRVTSGSR